MKTTMTSRTYVEKKIVEGELDLRQEGFTRLQLVEDGKQRRVKVPRESHAEWTPPKDRPDPVSIVLASNKGRQTELIPLRMSRMAASPFTFLRGAGAVMAWDLSTTPNIGHPVAMDDDAHLNNLGFYGTAQRDLIFDLNDFDEATYGPGVGPERLVASVNVALVWKLSKLDLRLVASHPYVVGGLGFLEGTSIASAPLVLAISVVIAGRWGHEVLYHGVHVNSLFPLAGVLVAVSVVIFNGPLLLIGRNLRGFKRRSLFEYGSLVGHHGRLVYQSWIRRQDIGSPDLLNAPELGPTVDISSIYEAVAKMRLAPISKGSLIPIVVAALLPMLPVYAIEVPITEILKKLAGALF